MPKPSSTIIPTSRSRNRLRSTMEANTRTTAATRKGAKTFGSLKVLLTRIPVPARMYDSLDGSKRNHASTPIEADTTAAHLNPSRIRCAKAGP